MASVPNASTSVSHSTPLNCPDSRETIEQRFRRLESVWIAGTGHLSSYTKIVNHPAFREIISLGSAVVPFMLKDLKQRASLWVWALPEITGLNPVDPSEAGKIGSMTSAWLRWAEENGYRL